MYVFGRWHVCVFFSPPREVHINFCILVENWNRKMEINYNTGFILLLLFLKCDFGYLRNRFFLLSHVSMVFLGKWEKDWVGLSGNSRFLVTCHSGSRFQAKLRNELVCALRQRLAAGFPGGPVQIGDTWIKMRPFHTCTDSHTAASNLWGEMSTRPRCGGEEAPGHLMKLQHCCVLMWLPLYFI